MTMVLPVPRARPTASCGVLAARWAGLRGPRTCSSCPSTNARVTGSASRRARFDALAAPLDGAGGVAVVDRHDSGIVVRQGRRVAPARKQCEIARPAVLVEITDEECPSVDQPTRGLAPRMGARPAPRSPGSRAPRAHRSTTAEHANASRNGRSAKNCTSSPMRSASSSHRPAAATFGGLGLESIERVEVRRCRRRRRTACASEPGSGGRGRHGLPPTSRTALSCSAAY